MLARLFQITLVLFFVIFTIAFLAFIFVAGMSVGFTTWAETGGIVAVAGGISNNLLRALVLIPIILFVVYLAFRRSRLRR